MKLLADNIFRSKLFLGGRENRKFRIHFHIFLCYECDFLVHTYRLEAKARVGFAFSSGPGAGIRSLYAEAAGSSACRNQIRRE